MLKILCSLSLICFVSACEKKQTASEAVIQPICYQGKFLNTIVCSDVSAVQIISPSIDSFDLHYTALNGEQYDAAIALTIPQNFQDGQPFYFSLDSIYYTPAHTDNCFAVPDYSGHVKTIGRTGCLEKPD
jgi:hypothetical protein